MSEPVFYLILADIVLVGHFLFIVFVVLGLVLIVAGSVRGWRWVRSPGFRIAHLAGIGIVVAQAWIGVICPLTIWENELRQLGGGEVYSGSFVQHWLHRIVFFDAEPWVFTLVYTVFGLTVLGTWILAPPRRRRHPDRTEPIE